MVLLIIVAAFTFCTIVCFILGAYMKGCDDNFSKNAIKTVGTIVGFETKDGSPWDYPKVKFNDNGEEVVALCMTGGIKANYYHLGTYINIYYFRKET